MTSPTTTKRCICLWEYGHTHPRCPVHGHCQTCGSDDPRLVNAPNRKGHPSRFIWFDASILDDPDRKHWHCPDSFHTYSH